MKIYASYNIKGGSGKTASAVNLSYLSARGGAQTLLWDLDPQGAASFYFRIRNKIKGSGKKLIRGKQQIDPLIRGTDFEGLDLLPADFSYRHLDLHLDSGKSAPRDLARLLRPLSSQYERLFLDCPPGISLLADAVFVAADVLLVPIIPTTLSLRTLEQLASHILKKRYEHLEVLPFFSMVDRRRALHRTICDSVNGTFEPLRCEIPYSTVVERMGPERAPVACYAARSRAASAYESLWKEIVQRADS